MRGLSISIRQLHEVIAEAEKKQVVIQYKTTIGIVDDDQSVRKALRRLIKSVGLDAKAFASAKQFLDYSDWQRISVLILDVRMPGMTGLDLQKHLTDSGANIPLIFMTAHENTRAKKIGLEAGAVAFLQKPFGDQLLLNHIFSALGRKQTE